MYLGEVEIKERIDSENGLNIEPFVEEHVEPASLDLRLSSSFTKINPKNEIIDTRDKDSIEHTEYEKESIVLQPGESILGSTMETVTMPDDILGKVDGRSSIGRLSVVIHKTAGIIDPGFSGDITLEIENEGDSPVKLYSGDRICQILFSPVIGEVETAYGEERGSQYQGQEGATPSGMEFSSKQ